MKKQWYIFQTTWVVSNSPFTFYVEGRLGRVAFVKSWRVMHLILAGVRCVEEMRQTLRTTEHHQMMKLRVSGKTNEDSDFIKSGDVTDLMFLPFQAFKEYPTILSTNTIFKPGEPINVKIINVERYTSFTRDLLHPYMYGWFFTAFYYSCNFAVFLFSYEIEIKHAGYHWTIRRRHTSMSSVPFDWFSVN